MKVKFCLLLLCWLMPWLPGRLWHWGIALVLLWILMWYCRLGIVCVFSNASRKQLEYPDKWFWLACGLVSIIAFIAFTWQSQQLPFALHKRVLLVSGCYQMLSGDVLPGVIQVSYPHFLLPVNSSAEQHYTRYNFNQGVIKLNVYNQALLTAFKEKPYGRLHAQIKLNKPKNYQNTHSFDYVAWNKRNSVLGNGYIKQHLTLWDGCYAPLSRWRSSLHQRLAQRLANMQMSGIAKVLWQALITGNTQGLSSHNWQVLKRTGTIHLFIISGLHVGLVAGFIALFLRGLLFAWPSPARTKLIMLLGCAGGLAFAWFSGFGMPAQRASIMLVFAMLGQYIGIAWPLLQRLLVAFCLTILLLPNSIYQQGFWFSYVAVANLAFVWQKYTHLTNLEPSAAAMLKRWGLNFWRATRLMLSNQLGLLCLLTPVVGFATGGISLAGPLVNLFLIPIFALFLVPALLVLSILLLISPIALFINVTSEMAHNGADFYTDTEGYAKIVTTLVGWMDAFIQGLWQPLSAVSEWSWAFINVAHWPAAVWLLWVFVGFVWLAFGLRLWLPFLAMLMLGLQPLEKPYFKLSVLDVGQGLAVWVQSDQHNMLYDVGDRFSSGFNHMQAVILPELLPHNVHTLDKVYVSHWDKDHAGGVEWLSQAKNDLQVKQWILPVQTHDHYENNYLSLHSNQLQPHTNRITRCNTQGWHTFGKVKIRHLSTHNAALKGNNGSCVIQIQIGDRRILLPGDIEKETEAKLVNIYGEQLRSDILLSPHHGSKTSSSSAFLQAVKPKVVIISAGKNNRFNHPHTSVLEAYKRHDIVWYSTAQHGRIDVSVKDANTPWLIAWKN